MFGVSPKLILITGVFVMVTLELPLVSGLKCYDCSSKPNVTDECHYAPKPSSVKSNDIKEIDPPHCYISISYLNKNKQAIVQVVRGIDYVDPSLLRTAERFKNYDTAVILPECTDVNKFLEPKEVMIDDGTNEFSHRCYCKKDMCNSVVLPK